jgi:hypothetical protein
MSLLKPRMTQPSEIDYESKLKYFAHLPASVVKATFKHTTQNMRLPPSTYLHKMFKSSNPSANLKRSDKADSTDQIFLDTPAINGGEKSAHLFVGKKLKLTDDYKSKDSSSTEFLKCLQDRVRYRGCPTGLEADNAHRIPFIIEMLSFHYGNVNRNTSIRITLKIDGRQSSDTQTASWITVAALLISGS